jgi:gliding motility-associated lipoprotein GldH
MPNLKLNFFLIGLILFVFSGCFQSNVFEKNIEIPDFNWDYQFVPTFQVNIDDTASFYSLSMNIRHQDEYPFSNIWVQLHGTSPEGKNQVERVQVALATKEGRWLGEGLNGVWMTTLPLKNKIKFPEKGVYTFGLEQDMRRNPLPNIMNIGLKVVKLK